MKEAVKHHESKLSHFLMHQCDYIIAKCRQYHGVFCFKGGLHSIRFLNKLLYLYGCITNLDWQVKYVERENVVRHKISEHETSTRHYTKLNQAMMHNIAAPLNRFRETVGMDTPLNWCVVAQLPFFQCRRQIKIYKICRIFQRLSQYIKYLLRFLRTNIDNKISTKDITRI